jgi:alkylation response protein AidB-like acyl-CoA dehydrogenase
LDFALEEKHQSFLSELRAYLKHLEESGVIDLAAVSAEYRDDLMSLRELGTEFIQQLGRDGWLGIGTPKKYGGQGRSFVEQWLFMEELKYRCLPAGQLLIQSIIPALVMLAPDEVRERYLPLCLSGNIMLAVGYSEPSAGTDLAALQTRATRFEGGYRLNGQKIWTTNGHCASHIWLAARTGAPDSRHKGISLFIVPMNTPGITVAPIFTQGGERTNHVYFSDVVIPEDSRVGGENDGWRLIMGQLAFERMFCPAEMMREFHAFLHWWSVNQPASVAEREHQLRELGRIAAEAEVCRLMATQTAWMMDQGLIPDIEASILKPYLTGTHQRTAIDCLRLAGSWGQLRYGEPSAPAFGRMERAYRVTPSYTFGAGANELQRDMVAERGLGLPRSRA